MPPLPVLYPGDCLETMAALAAMESQFDAVVCDPPYHLTSVVDRFGAADAAPAKHGTDGLYARQSRGFMGKQWDGGRIAFDPATWRLAFDLLKPGAHLVAFGGSRTWHRTTCAIEDAGFEIRDSLAWIYGTGFPHSHNVAQDADGLLGGKGERVATGGPVARMIPGADQLESGWIKDSGREFTPGRYLPDAVEAAALDGWGTTLKPSFEPIILARKPPLESIARNMLRFGVGGLNIDACRVPGVKDVPSSNSGTRQSQYGYGAAQGSGSDPAVGRWPANVVHDGSAEVLEAFARYGSRGAAAPASGRTLRNPTKGVARGEYAGLPEGRAPAFYGDKGTAARFFYSAKAGKADRAGSKHPTIKPQSLMTWLCRLIVPPGGTVLDPFAGSGSTLQAAYRLGMTAVGCEREPEYCDDIRRRIAALTHAPRVAGKATIPADLADFLA